VVVPDPCTAKEIVLFTTMLPASEPETVGLKMTLTDTLCPGDSVSGNAGWLTL